MSLTDEEKIRICKFWEEKPDLLGEDVSDNYNHEDIANLLILIAGSGGLTIDKVERYRRKIEAHQMQKESNEIQKSQSSYKRDILIAVITAIVTSIITNIDRIIKWMGNLN